MTNETKEMNSRPVAVVPVSEDEMVEPVSEQDLANLEASIQKISDLYRAEDHRPEDYKGDASADNEKALEALQTGIDLRERKLAMLDSAQEEIERQFLDLTMRRSFFRNEADITRKTIDAMKQAVIMIKNA